MGKIREKVAEMTDLPKDVIMDLPKIVIIGNREMQIDNYKGLLEYSQEVIRVATNNKHIIITGADLGINRMESETLFIGGRITSIEFCSKNKK